MKTIAGVQVQVDGQGEDLIIMVHGWPDSLELWDAQVQALQSHYRCARFTLPGYAAGDERRAYRLDEIVTIIDEVANALSPARPVILLLHDWGCFFGYRYAALHPERVAKIIGLDIGDAGSAAHRKALTPKAKMMAAGYQIWLAAAWRIGGALGDRMTRYMAAKMRVPVEASQLGAHLNYPYYIRWTGSHGSYRDVRPFEPAGPMLFVYGRKKLFMFHSQPWVDALNARPGSRAIGMDTGHWMMRSKPDQLNEHILSWLFGEQPDAMLSEAPPVA